MRLVQYFGSPILRWIRGLGNRTTLGLVLEITISSGFQPCSCGARDQSNRSLIVGGKERSAREKMSQTHSFMQLLLRAELRQVKVSRPSKLCPRTRRAIAASRPFPQLIHLTQVVSHTKRQQVSSARVTGRGYPRAHKARHDRPRCYLRLPFNSRASG